ncbi:MAG: flagellar hook-associated protein FlgL [Gammaproteobacteria bacterium]|nr:flagellar hook-associated protein FlgL [Gammaproteobacteria bacterium]
MRVSTSFFYSQGLKNMLDQQSKLLRVQDQLGQGVKNLSPSDDPSAAARVLGLNQSITKIEQYGENAVYAKQRLELEESTLDSVNLVLQRVRELTVQAGNIGTGDMQTRKAITAEIKQRIDELLDLANSRDVNGDYLFSGFKSRTQPFFADGAGNYIYNGDQGQMDVKIGNTRKVTVSDSGADVFQKIRTGNGTFVVDSGLRNDGTGIIRQGSVINSKDYVAHDYMLQFRPRDELQSAKFSATTAPLSINYTGTTFDISVDGSAASPVTFDQDMTGQPPLVIAKAVAAEINADLGRDVVKGAVDANGNMIIETLEKNGQRSSLTFSNLGGAAASLGLTAINVSGTDAPVEGTQYFDVIDLNLSPGTVISADIGTLGVDIYATDQPAVIAGTTDLSLGADFDTAGPTSITFNVNGETQTVKLSGIHNAANVTGYIQTEINNAFGPSVLSVSRLATGEMEFATAEQGADIDLRVVGVANNVTGLPLASPLNYASGVDQNNLINVYLDGSNTPLEIKLTAGTNITAATIAAEIDAATGINASATLNNEIVINSDRLGQTATASLVFQGNALQTLGINIVNTVVGLPAREYSAESSFTFDGHEVSIEGEPNGDDVFSVKASRHQDIFSSLQNLVNDLENPPNDENALSLLAQLSQSVANTIANISQSQESIINTRTGIGARLHSIDSQENQNFAESNQLQKVRSDIIDLDYAEAISQLNFQMTALQASQQSFAKVQQLSLFDYL